MLPVEREPTELETLNYTYVSSSAQDNKDDKNNGKDDGEKLSLATSATGTATLTPAKRKYTKRVRPEEVLSTEEVRTESGLGRVKPLNRPAI